MVVRVQEEEAEEEDLDHMVVGDLVEGTDNLEREGIILIHRPP
jgi:hypothetical protein